MNATEDSLRDAVVYSRRLMRIAIDGGTLDAIDAAADVAVSRSAVSRGWWRKRT